MKVLTARLDEDLLDALDEEAEELGFANRTEYVRNILRNRDRIRDNTPDNTPDNTSGDERIRDNTSDNTPAYTGKYEILQDCVEALETRVDELEAGGDGGVDLGGFGLDETPHADVEPSDAAREALSATGWSKGRNREERQQNAAVAAWALEVLRDADRELRRADIPVEALDDDRKPDTIWHGVIRPAILAARDEGYVETDDSDQRYRWVGK